jgi:hypothetical protein
MDGKRLASFFVDDSKSDKYEELADFYIAWTLRCAEEKYAAVDNAVHTYSKRLLSKLVKGDPYYLDNKDVLSVKTWKQRDAVDIWVEAKIREECGDTTYSLIIEDKYCSKLTEAQLEKYKKICVRNKIDAQYFVIRLEQNDKYDKSDEDACNNCGYTLLRWTDLKNIMGLTKCTGNALFDEFWFYWEKDVSSGTPGNGR